MMNIKTLVVDDEPLARRGICSRLSAYPYIDIIGECSNGRQAVEMLRNTEVDLVFLDIQMPGLGGFDVIDKIGPSKMPSIVFTTAYDEFAIRAFEVRAFDYILKPIDDDRFNHTLKHIYEQKVLSKTAAEHTKSGAPSAKRIMVKSSGKSVFIDYDQIQWVEASGDYVLVHTASKSHLVRKTMKTMTSALDVDGFMRISRSAIVNISFIASIKYYRNGEYYINLKDSRVLRSSRTYKDAVRNLLD